MNRLTGVILVILGLVLVVGGLYPSGLFGRLHGVGAFSSGNNTADILVIVGAVALVIGIFSLLSRQQA
jgi:predicted phage tail protein